MIVAVLQDVQPELQYEFVGLVAELSFVVVRLNECLPLPARDDAIHLRNKFFFLRPNLSQLIAERGQRNLLIHTAILPRFEHFCTPYSLCGVALRPLALSVLFHERLI